MKAIICGGRSFNPKNFKEKYPNFEQKLIDIFKENNIDEEVCGMAAGADMYGAHFAKKNGINVKEFEALWSNISIQTQDEPVLVGLNEFGHPYNTLAGINRNKRMGDYVKNNGGGIVIALPGGSGTKHMVNYGTSIGLTIYEFDKKSGDFIKLNNKGDKNKNAS